VSGAGEVPLQLRQYCAIGMATILRSKFPRIDPEKAETSATTSSLISQFERGAEIAFRTGTTTMPLEEIQAASSFSDLLMYDTERLQPAQSV